MQAGVAKGVGLVYYVLHRELVANPVYGLWAEVQENRQPEVRLPIRSFQERRRHLSWICVDYSDPVLKLWERVILPRFFHQVSGIHASDFAEDETTNGIRSLARIEAVLMVVTTMSSPRWIRLQRTGDRAIRACAPAL